MEMQNDIRSPLAGKDVKVHVKTDANVEASTGMIEIQAPAPDAFFLSMPGEVHALPADLLDRGYVQQLRCQC